jgi:hypothetical protein
MRHALWVGTLAAVVIPSSARAADGAAIDTAIARGVKALQRLQQRDGTWNYPPAEATVGSTALASATLLECGVDKADPGLVKATKFIRDQVPTLKHTYSVALSLIFLDRLGDPADVPLIESLTARLVAGQDPGSGGWLYSCPEPLPAEQARLRAIVGGQAADEEPTLVAGQAAGEEQRTAPGKPTGATKQFARRLAALNPKFTAGGSDNSNTQFAVLGLWVARRHGYPVDLALKAAETHFRSTQNPNDGGWSYRGANTGMGGSAPAMTCAGLLSLAAGTGVTLDLVERAREKSGQTDRRKGTHDPNKDIALKAGLLCLANSIGTPIARTGDAGFGGAAPLGGLPFPQAGPDVTGRSYYFLWSLERVAAILNMDTIGKKDWYGWGSDVIVAAQQADGTWRGAYPTGGVDTCFALLFLRKANFAKDLSKLMGRIEDGGTRSLKSGGLGGSSLVPPKEEGMRTKAEDADAGPAPVRVSNNRTRPKSFGDTTEAKIADQLLDLPDDKRAAEIDRLRGQKGVANTVALAMAIPYLSIETRNNARQALAERMARMTTKTIADHLTDEDSEIRAAAARACPGKGAKEAKEMVPQLIALLSDKTPYVARCAHLALKEISGRDFGPSPGAEDAAVQQAIGDWQAWWQKQGR